MKLGVLVEAEEGLDWDHWRSTFRATERLGFESVWISDHLQSSWGMARRGLEPWIALAVAAAETRSILLGPLVSPITFREPVVIARMAEALDDLSVGRFVLGLGLGWNVAEHAAAGLAFPPAPQRSERLGEGIARIRREVGERRFPILIGGKGARSTLPIVARYADEWNVTTSSIADFTRAATELDKLCSELGRDPHEIRRSVAMGVLVGSDTAELERRCERMRQIVPPLAEVDDVPRAVQEMGWFAGTPDELVSTLKVFAGAGVDRVMLGHYDLDDVSVLELIARQVIPTVA
jgi:alkanesulfonate monooxygenase SsuD/methylene tetrahydromethanopterin reductase-like flavin-dependent oxidoreductase (luciferase family)